MKTKHRGSNFDDYLREEQLLDAVEATAVKRVIAFQIAQEMKRRRLTKTEMASRMKTSRAALERLLDPGNPSVTISTLERAALVLGEETESRVGVTPCSDRCKAVLYIQLSNRQTDCLRQRSCHIHPRQLLAIPQRHVGVVERLGRPGGYFSHGLD